MSDKPKPPSQPGDDPNGTHDRDAIHGPLPDDEEFTRSEAETEQLPPQHIEPRPSISIDLPPEPDQPHAAPGTHAAPTDAALFDQDPAEVQARWRDLQSCFVDDPGQAVQRADGLVGEVVESLTSTLSSRTNALRDRWKSTDADTEQLRLALRDYRNVLEQLLALSSAPPLQSQGTR
ncbi:hypothetical protein ACWEPC_38825 [Nonomuraea sp. NPDC004297]